jgi:hypothetical protein
MKATWTRLDNGNWGVRVESALGALLDTIVGQEIEVSRSDGTTSTQRVTAVEKRFEPRPAGRVRGRTIPAITAFLAICEVEPREKVPFKKSAAPATRKPRAARSSSEARERARAEWRARPLATEENVSSPADSSRSVEVTLTDLLAKPSRLSAESTLTRA